MLTIRGERVEARQDGEEPRYHVAERSYGSFMRRFQLPQGIDDQQIKADVEGGMLYVHVRKTALPQPKQIHITTGANGNKQTQKVIGGAANAVQGPIKGTRALQTK